jgi:chemotaxis protein methyltransferase CheR
LSICVNEVLPGLVTRAKSGGRVRIWSAGCSDGQEPYSIALTVLGMVPNAATYDIRILATDIDPKIIAQAKAGIYDEQAIETVTPPCASNGSRKSMRDGFRSMIRSSN